MLRSASMWRSFALVLMAAGTVLACGSQNDEGPAGSSGAAGSGAAGTSSGGGHPSAGTGNTAGASGGSAGASGGTAGASGGSADASGGTVGASAGNGGSSAGAGQGGATASCTSALVGADVSHLMATEQDEDYSVAGNTANELRLSINANRGHDYDGLTTWNIQWGFQDCAAPMWNISLDITYSMPSWNAPAGADPILLAQWRSYSDALHCHEYGHGKLALDCAHRVYDGLAAVAGSSDCSAVSSSAQAIFDGILADCQAREVSYDSDTNHGASMGAIFPP